MFESCCVPYPTQSTAAHVSAFLQTDGKVKSGQENPGETEVLGARTGVSKLCLEHSLFLHIQRPAALLPLLHLGGYITREGGAPI